MRGELRFSRSTDYAAIRALLTDPRCYPRMAGDGAPMPCQLIVGPCEGIEHVVGREDGRPVALFMLVRVKGADPEVHFCIAPEAWGRSAPIARAFLAWVWQNTTETRLIGPVPAYNRLALRLAKAVGFTEYGVLANAVRKHGVACDLILTEIRKPV